MTPPELHFVVPGPVDQLTGGFVYDARMVEGLRTLGWRVRVHELRGRFPGADQAARAAMSDVLAALTDDAWVVIDGLAMGGMPEAIEAHAERLRIVSMVHHPLAEESGLPLDTARRLEETERRALGAVAGVVVSSEFTARGLGDYGVPAAKVRVVVPGTDPAPSAGGPRPGEPPVLLCVASVTPRKGHDVLVAALGRIRDLEWRCVCAGSLERDPPHAASVLRAAEEAGVIDRVDFVGERHGEGLAELYHGASASVLASHYEGYGMALAEALARGLPVVSTTGGAIPFTVPADAGILVEPGNAEALAEALRTVVEPGSSRRAELSEGARRHAERLPTWPDAAGSFAAAVGELAS